MLLRLPCYQIQAIPKKKIAAHSGTKKRTKYVVRDRIDWKSHSQQLLNEGQFRRFYRMSPTHFEHLLSKIAPKLIGNTQMSTVATKKAPITPVNKLHMFICFITGHHYQSARIVGGISKSSFYRCVWQVADCIGTIADDDLAVTFPRTNEEIKKLQLVFVR
jgi:hypothetical protein